MADITMCQNRQCPMRELCYRFTANANELYQSYALFKPNSAGVCENFVANTGYQIGR